MLTHNRLIQLYESNDNLKDYEKICELTVSKGYKLRDETVQELFALVQDEISSGKDGNYTAYWYVVGLRPLMFLSVFLFCVRSCVLSYY